jgi:hypothetical protein
MSTELAIASVTAVLKDLLNNGLIDHDISGAIGGNVTVTALPPDRIDTTAPNEQSQLNLFLYRVTPNQGWRNVGLPSRDGRGERLTNPPLALDLHYLLTAYGSDELHTDILLGYGMQLLHEMPVLARGDIRKSLAPPSTVGGGGLPARLQALATSELAEQMEQIKIIPEALNTEEISKLWSAFQAKYRPTAAYRASVVLIESRKPTRSALPVLKRLLYVDPFKQPVIEKILSQATAGDDIVENQPILPGYNLVLRGRNLKGEDTRLNIGGIEVVPQPQSLSDTEITVPVPGGLAAGVQAVQVIHLKPMGEPAVPHRGVESGVAAFVLRPVIQTVTTSNVQAVGTNLLSGDLDVKVKPAVTKDQRVVILLNGEGQTPAAYSFQLAARTSETPIEDLRIPFTKLKTGAYLVRIRVDGAESPLSVDSQGRYEKPRVSIS